MCRARDSIGWCQQTRGPQIVQRPMRSSFLTPRWRRQSLANPSLKPEFPASWENTGNSVRLGLRVRLLVRNYVVYSMVYDAIPYASEQGIYFGLTGNQIGTSGNLFC